MPEPALALGPRAVIEVFPFHLAFDRQLRLVQHGRAAAKVCSNVVLGAPFASLVSLHRPRIELSFEALRRSSATFFVDSLTTKIRMRGQMTYEESSDAIVFLGAPWFTDIEELRRSQLELSDFTVHDPIVDFLSVVQAKSVALADATKFSAMLASRRDELERANEELARASSAKSQFLANTSRELGCPLGEMMGMVGRLLGEELPADHRVLAEAIRSSAESLLVVVNDVADLSRIEAGTVTLERTDFDVHETVADVAEVFAPSAKEKGVDLVCVIAPEVPRLVGGDPSRLRQVLSNLLSNAVKFTSSGEIILRVEVCEEAAARIDLRFSVTDTGIGIHKEACGRIFRAFTQVDPSGSRKYGGRGLGLAISQQLVQLMGGTLSVESSPGAGSKFCFAASLERRPVGAARTYDLSGVRALVVDVGPTSRDHVGELLASCGASVATSGDPARALEMIQTVANLEELYDVVIIDADGGSEHAIRRRTTSVQSSATRLMLLFAIARPDPAKLGVRVDAYARKPIRADRFLDTVAQLVHRGAPSPELEPVALPPPST